MDTKNKVMKANIYAPLNKWHRFDQDHLNLVIATRLENEKSWKTKEKRQTGNPQNGCATVDSKQARRG